MKDSLAAAAAVLNDGVSLTELLNLKEELQCPSGSTISFLSGRRVRFQLPNLWLRGCRCPAPVLAFSESELTSGPLASK